MFSFSPTIFKKVVYNPWSISTGCAASLLLVLFPGKFVFAGLSGNPGFENSTTGYTFSSNPPYSINSASAYIRSGSASLKVSTTSTTDLKASHTGGAISAPATGYVIVTAYVKGENTLLRSKIGVYNSSTATEYSGAGYTTAATGSFTKITGAFACVAGETYYPVIFSNSSSGATATGEYDDLVMYFSNTNTVDATAPATAPSAIQSSVSGTTINLSWTAGGDAESGVDGYLVLRLSGLISSGSTAVSQVNYATSSTQGPTSISTATVVYNGNATTYSDNPGATGSYTYLVYTRDKAYNYTALGSAATMLAINGSSLNGTLPAAMTIDGLYIAPTCSLTIPSGRTFTIRSGSAFSVDGTIIDIGGIVNNGTVTFLNGSNYEYDHNAVTDPVIPATWNSGSAVKITGVKNVVPSGLNQTFANLTWNCSNQNRDVPLPATFNVTGTFTMTNTNSRTVTFSSTSISGNIVQTGGDLAFTAGTTMTLNGTTKQVIAITNSLASLTLNNSAGAALGSNVTVSETLNLQSGALTDSSFVLTMASGSTINRSSGSLSETPTLGGTLNLIYSASLITGNEVPAVGANNVNIDASPAVTLNSVLRVNGTLTFSSGIINSSAGNYLHMAAGSSVSGASDSKHVNGVVRKTGNTAFTFPVGDGTTYSPISISAPSLATDQYSASYNRANTSSIGTALATGVYHVSTAEYWTLNRTAGSSNVSASLSWSSSSLVTYLPELIVTTWNGSQWISQGNASTSGTTSAGSITSNTLSGYGNITLGSSNHSVNWLPVELISFNSECRDNSVGLKWSTASESNNDYFELLRSNDARNYSSVARIPSSGNTSGNNYNYEDFSNSFENPYYRLVQVDYDGKSEILSTLAVNCDNKAVALNVYNAAAPKLKAEIVSNGNYSIRIADITGRTLSETLVYMQDGTNIIELGQLPADSILMCILTNDQGERYPLKFILAE